jgi:hypothetical protein
MATITQGSGEVDGVQLGPTQFHVVQIDDNTHGYARGRGPDGLAGAIASCGCCTVAA